MVCKRTIRPSVPNRKDWAFDEAASNGISMSFDETASNGIEGTLFNTTASFNDIMLASRLTFHKRATDWINWSF